MCDTPAKHVNGLTRPLSLNDPVPNVRERPRLARSSTTKWRPNRGISAPSAARPTLAVVDSTSTTATQPTRPETSYAATATADSDTPKTTPTPSEQQPATSENTRLPLRSRQILKWRKQGDSYGTIAKRLDISRQRATQLWEQAQTAEPAKCRCGATIPLNTKEGRPKTYCRPEHRPSQKTTPPKRCSCGTALTDRRKNYCGPEHAPLRQHAKRTGLSKQQYNQMAEHQNNLCAICQQPETATLNGKIKRLAVDHDHTTNQTRELLCNNCNSMLGYYNDNPELLEKAANYLEKHAV